MGVGLVSPAAVDPQSDRPPRRSSERPPAPGMSRHDEKHHHFVHAARNPCSQTRERAPAREHRLQQVTHDQRALVLEAPRRRHIVRRSFRLPRPRWWGLPCLPTSPTEAQRSQPLPTQQHRSRHSAKPQPIESLHPSSTRCPCFRRPSCRGSSCPRSDSQQRRQQHRFARDQRDTTDLDPSPRKFGSHTATWCRHRRRQRAQDQNACQREPSHAR